MASSSSIHTAAVVAGKQFLDAGDSHSSSEESHHGSLTNVTSSQEEESGTESTDDSEEGDMETVPGGVKPLLHNQHSKEERAILLNGKAQWMSCQGSACKKVFLRIASELRKLPNVKDMNEAEWDSHQRVCTMVSVSIKNEE